MHFIIKNGKWLIVLIVRLFFYKTENNFGLVIQNYKLFMLKVWTDSNVCKIYLIQMFKK